MPTAWRIISPKRAAAAFSGEGARLYGGRWNPPGVSLVYTAESRALAALEILVHVDDGELLEEYLCIPVSFEKHVCRVLNLNDLPFDWRASPAPVSTRRMGEQWALERLSAVLQVPSVLIPGESNYLLNPLHPDFRKLSIGSPQPFEFDPRLR